MTDYERGKADGRRETLGELKAVYRVEFDRLIGEAEKLGRGSIWRCGMLTAAEAVQKRIDTIESREAADDGKAV